MIIKRKSGLAHCKSKEKLKTNQQADAKKGKKNSNQTKLTTSASVKAFKVQQHHFKQQKHETHAQNQNFNLMNFQNKGIMDLEKNWLKQHHEEEEREFTTHRLRKSASTGGMRICKSTRKSLSPMINKEKQQNLKIKYSSKQTSRSSRQKQKVKIKTIVNEQKNNKSSSKLKQTLMKYTENKKKVKATKVVNKSTKTTRHQSQHLKTQQSSKMPSVSKEMDQKKPKKKVQANGSLKRNKSKQILNKGKNPNRKTKGSFVFSDVSFREEEKSSAIVAQQNFYLKFEEEEKTDLAIKIQASIVIQKHFRGYLTRKYIEQLKFMVLSVIKIQKVWRGYSCRKKLKKMNRKNLSIENSLITIKDFSEQPKQDKLKQKHFTFLFEQLSNQKKSEQVSEKKQLPKRKSMNEKYTSLLQSLLEEEELQERIKKRIRESLGKNKQGQEMKEQKKQEYVQKKIHSEIISEKSFHSSSPRNITSPKANILINSPSSWIKNKSFENMVEPYSSPITEKVAQRMSSPGKMVSPRSSIKNTTNVLEPPTAELQILPFDTSFEFFEEFELKIIDFMKAYPEEFDEFLDRCKSTQYFKTNLVLENWNEFIDIPQSDNDLSPQFCSNDEILCPVIFTKDVKNKVMRESPMQIYLEERKYFQQLWNNSDNQKQAYEGMIQLIFDSLSESIYCQYKDESIFKINKSRNCTLEGYDLFTNIFMNSLARVQTWTEYHCGMEIPVDQNDPNHALYVTRKKEREQLAVKSDITAVRSETTDSWKLWLQVMAAQLIFQQLVEQVQNEKALIVINQ